MGGLVLNAFLMVDAGSTLIATGVFFFCSVVLLSVLPQSFCCFGVFDSSDFAAFSFWLGVSMLKRLCCGFFGVFALGDQLGANLFGEQLIQDVRILLANPLGFAIVNDFNG